MQTGRRTGIVAIMASARTTLDRQLLLLSAYGLLTYPFACVPFLFFYFRDHGIDLPEYTRLISGYYAAMVIMEIPTGIFADKFGRRSSMVAGSFILGASFLAIWLWEGFAVYLTAEVLMGVGHSLLSGAPTALLFDLLKREDQESAFLTAESRIHAMRLIGTGGSFLLGGAIAHGNGIAPTILLTGLLCLVGALIAALVHEPRRTRATGAPPLMRAALRDMRSPTLLWVLVYFVILFGLLRFAFHTYQPYWRETMFDAADERANWLWLGGLFFALNLLAAPASRLAPRLSRHVRFRPMFLSFLVAISIAFIVMGLWPGWLGIAMFFVHQLPFGLHWALIQEFVNKRVATVARATALSILSFAGRIVFVLLFPIAGAFQNEHGTPATYLWIGWIGLGATAAWFAPFLGGRLLRREHASPVPEAGEDS